MVRSASWSKMTHARRPELDGLRGVAILLVLASHAHVPGFAREGGAVGVGLFFVLSGYLITSILVAEHARVGRVGFRTFYLRRALRLFPALGALLLTVVVASVVFHIQPGPPTRLGPTVAAVVAYVGNWYQALGNPLGILGQTWTLAVEEQFYIIWPTLLVLAMAVVSPRTAGILILGLAILITPWRLVLLGIGDIGHVYFGTDTHADALLVGCAIAILGTRLPARWGWAAIIALVAVDMAWPDGTLAALALGLPLTAFLGWVAVASCPGRLAWAPLAYVGRISYGLYLWHYLFIWSGLPWPVVLAVSFGVAMLSYHLLETPFLRLKDRFSTAPARPDLRLALEPALVPERGTDRAVSG